MNTVINGVIKFHVGCGLCVCLTFSHEFSRELHLHTWTALYLYLRYTKIHSRNFWHCKPCSPPRTTDFHISPYNHMPNFVPSGLFIHLVMTITRKVTHKPSIASLSVFFNHGATAPSGSGPPRYCYLRSHSRHIILGRTPMDEWSARRRDLYRTTQNTRDRNPWPGRDSKPREAAGPRLRQCGNWDRPALLIPLLYFQTCSIFRRQQTSSHINNQNTWSKLLVNEQEICIKNEILFLCAIYKVEVF